MFEVLITVYIFALANSSHTAQAPPMKILSYKTVHSPYCSYITKRKVSHVSLVEDRR